MKTKGLTSITIIIIALIFLGVVAVGGYLLLKPSKNIFKPLVNNRQPTSQPPVNGGQKGYCGDGICDQIEKNNKVCPEDCEEKPTTKTEESPADLPIPSKSKITFSVNADSEIRELPLELSGTLGVNYHPGLNEEDFANAWDLFSETNGYIVDISVIGDKTIPYFPSFDADPEDASNYEFDFLDKKVSAAIEHGYKISLSVSDLTSSPSDYDKYGTIVEHLMKHLTQEWAGGFNLTENEIKLVIYGNEPDLNNAFWFGTEEDFQKTYATFAKAVKKVNKNIPVGAPSYAMATDDNDTINQYVVDFLDYMKNNNVPLDYFSWHQYSIDTNKFYKSSQTIENLLKEYDNLSPLYGSPKSMNDEWNMIVGYGLGSEKYHNELADAWGASHALSSLISMIKGGLDASVHFVGMGTGDVDLDFTLSDSQGNLRPKFYMFKALSNLKTANVMVSSQDKDIYGFNVLPVKSNDGKTAVIFISSFNIWKYAEKYSSDPKTIERLKEIVPQDSSSLVYFGDYEIQFSKSDWAGKSISYSRYLIDDTHDYELVESGVLEGSNLTISEEIAMPQIQIIILSIE